MDPSNAIANQKSSSTSMLPLPSELAPTASTANNSDTAVDSPDLVKIAPASPTQQPDLPAALSATVPAVVSSNTMDPQEHLENIENGSISATSPTTSNNNCDGAEPMAMPEDDEKKPVTVAALGKTYLEIVQEGLADMNNRNGTSLVMIKKWIAANYSSLAETPYFNGRLNKAIRNGVTTKKLIKIRASYKLNSNSDGASNSAGNSKKKRKNEDATSTPEGAELEQKMQSIDPDKATQLRRQAKVEEDREREKKESEVAERLRKRRFPMEDTKLHAEDKELKVKPPAKVKSRPQLPYFWHIPLPLDHPDRKGKTPGLILTYSKADFLDVDSRGLVSDLLQVYHFFRGDVHFDLIHDDEQQGIHGSGIVPEFSLKHLIYAVDQIMNGNARKTKQIPPLIVHLFVTCLQILLSGIGSYSSPNEAHTYAELHKYLGPALTPVSWGDICHLYMDAMERYYTTEASLEPNVLETEPLIVEYLLGKTDIMETTKIEGSGGYLGHTNGSLYKAHHKLGKQDPWALTAEELMAVLRALTEDVLALHPEIMDHRDEQLQELTKNKRLADAKYRKVRLAFEGPVKKESGKSDVPFKPTASKRQFDAAKKAQEVANDAYQKGCRNLIARTEPIGRDRNFNEVYCFLKDPEVLYIEERRPAATTNTSRIPAELLPGRRSWHAIETMSLFDHYVSSLDTRGKREYDLYNELVGKSDESPRQYLIDDVSMVAEAEARLKEKQKLEKRLEEVRRKCQVDESARRRSRQSLPPEDELREIEIALENLREAEHVKSPPSVYCHNWDELTGLVALQNFEKAKKMDKRRTRETKVDAIPQNVPILYCSHLSERWDSENYGSVGMIATSLLVLEDRCNSLVQWSRKDMSREIWLTRLRETILSWNSLSSRQTDTPKQAGTRSAPTSASSMNGHSLHTNMQNGHGSCFSPASNLNAPSIIATLKQLLLDLEDRVADITNVALATHDADLADDNMSTQSEQGKVSNETAAQRWKKYVKKIQNTPTKRYAKIRELLVSAIADARKAHLPDIVSQLRAALSKYRPSASSTDCKEAAIMVLESNGGYDPMEEDAVEGKEEASPLDELPSVVSAEAVTLRSSLDGFDDSRREDWVEAVKSAKTISRFAALCAAFVNDAMERVTKLEEEHKSLQKALVEWKKPPKEQKVRKRGSPVDEKFEDPSEVWADVYITDDLCMVKAVDFPWWPAKKCTAKDARMAEDLKEVNRSLVAFMGEMGAIRVVPNENIKPFDGQPVIEEGMEYAKDMTSQLDDCLAMARRITRGIQKQSAMKV